RLPRRAERCADRRAGRLHARTLRAAGSAVARPGRAGRARARDAGALTRQRDRHGPFRPSLACPEQVEESKPAPALRQAQCERPFLAAPSYESPRRTNPPLRSDNPAMTSSIAIMGAGAVGCYFGAMLARAGHAVTLVGRPAHVDAVRQHGLRLQTAAFDEHIPMAASTGAAGVAGAQIVLFCVKSTDTESAGAQMREHLPPGALVLSLQNGVDNAARLQAVLPQQSVVPAVVYVATEMAGPGHVRHHGRGELVIGPSAGSDAAAQLLAAAGVPTQVSDNAIGALWAKLVLNCAYNAVSAI